MSNTLSELKEKMEKTIQSTHSKFSSIRTGRANPDLLSRIQVEYYGAVLPLKQMANISVSEGNTLVLTIFDAGAITQVEKAIQRSDLSINPQTEGNTIRLRLPDLTEDRRKELLKIVKQEAEAGKIALRNIRRDYLDAIKKKDDFSEDHLKSEQDKAQKIIDTFNKKIDILTKEKETELFEV